LGTSSCSVRRRSLIRNFAPADSANDSSITVAVQILEALHQWKRLQFWSSPPRLHWPWSSGILGWDSTITKTIRPSSQKPAESVREPIPGASKPSRAQQKPLHRERARGLRVRSGTRAMGGVRTLRAVRTARTEFFSSRPQQGTQSRTMNAARELDPAQLSQAPCQNTARHSAVLPYLPLSQPPLPPPPLVVARQATRERACGRHPGESGHVRPASRERHPPRKSRSAASRSRESHRPGPTDQHPRARACRATPRLTDPYARKRKDFARSHVVPTADPIHARASTLINRHP
jgi:hypothetical protein